MRRFRKNAAVRQKTKIEREPLEKDIQKTIVSYLKLKGIEVTVTDASRTWGKGGGVRQSKVDSDHPDLSCVLPVVVKDKNNAEIKLGLAFFIEVKTKTGSIRSGQKEKLVKLADAGALCVLARDVSEVVRVVDLFMNKEFDHSELAKETELLKLLLADRRKKEVRDALAAIRTHSKNGE
jgi:hypothetical protein